MDESALSEVQNNLGFVYYQLKKNEKAKEEFHKSEKLGNIKAKRNLRAIKNAEKKGIDLSGGIPEDRKRKVTIFIFLSLSICYILFIFFETGDGTRLLSDTMFVAQSSILMGLLIFVLFADQLVRLKVGTEGVELEMSTEHKSISAEAAPVLERS